MRNVGNWNGKLQSYSDPDRLIFPSLSSSRLVLNAGSKKKSKEKKEKEKSGWFGAHKKESHTDTPAPATEKSGETKHV